MIPCEMNRPSSPRWCGKPAVIVVWGRKPKPVCPEHAAHYLCEAEREAAVPVAVVEAMLAA